MRRRRPFTLKQLRAIGRRSKPGSLGYMVGLDAGMRPRKAHR